MGAQDLRHKLASCPHPSVHPTTPKSGPCRHDLPAPNIRRSVCLHPYRSRFPLACRPSPQIPEQSRATGSCPSLDPWGSELLSPVSKVPVLLFCSIVAFFFNPFLIDFRKKVSCSEGPRVRRRDKKMTAGGWRCHKPE